MANELYDPGTKIRLSVRFTVQGALADPDTVTLKVQDPARAVTTYTYPATVVKDSTGIFHVDVTPNKAGRWVYKWIGTGAVTAQTEEIFRVRRQEIP